MQEDIQATQAPAMAGTAVGAMTPAVASQPVAPTMQVEFQGFWIRFAASLIDGLILGLIYFLLSIVSGMIFGLNISRGSSAISTALPIAILVSYGLLIVIYVLYDWGMLLKFNGQTIGKKLLGIRVISADGNKLTLGQIVLRELIGKIASGLIFDLGYIWAGFDPQKQAWHDKIAKTYVVKAK